jgi:hypothetical protein
MVLLMPQQQLHLVARGKDTKVATVGTVSPDYFVHLAARDLLLSSFWNHCLPQISPTLFPVHEHSMARRSPRSCRWAVQNAEPVQICLCSAGSQRRSQLEDLLRCPVDMALSRVPASMSRGALAGSDRVV